MNDFNSPENATRHTDWKLDPRLAADTIPIVTESGCAITLMNDSRWPWLIIVPNIPGAEELHDLDPAQQETIMGLSIRLGEALKSVTGAEKINTAAIGNIVRQLHIHVVARSQGDPNWPAPVWGYGTADSYAPDQISDLIAQIRTSLEA